MTAVSDDNPTLMQRRRAETRLEIQRAALRLFEEQGVAETTVAQIAAAAGVSARTVFRYFEVKELAALPGLSHLLTVAGDFTPEDGTAAHVLTQLEDRLTEELHYSELDSIDSQRLATLFASEPLLLEAAAAQLQRVSTIVHAAIIEHCPSLSSAEALLIPNVAMTVWHASWETYGLQAQTGDTVDAATNFRDHCRILRSFVE